MPLEARIPALLGFGRPAVTCPARAAHLVYAKRAVDASNGEEAWVFDTLAEAFFANGKFDEAIKAEERAIEMAPKQDAYRDQLTRFREAKRKAGE